MVPPNPLKAEASVHVVNSGPHCEELTELGKAVAPAGVLRPGQNQDSL